MTLKMSFYSSYLGVIYFQGVHVEKIHERAECFLLRLTFQEGIVG